MVNALETHTITELPTETVDNTVHEMLKRP